ncbi:hypothetical protein [Pseudomonas umsongensis]|jgi:hypothetical protein|uniref:hypothetical protein n=1 Tax=Pseudomonas umsongensis TaxID=198618 RepID=UPI0015BAEAA8|nr:hypothetical protein [Pseudomonas umsongensis]NWL18838.1 hypothetical protein [Pseudomonas umsongensis]
MKFLKGLVLALLSLVLLSVLGIIGMGVYEHRQEQAAKQAILECALAEQFPKVGYDCKIPGLGKKH